MPSTEGLGVQLTRLPEARSAEGRDGESGGGRGRPLDEGGAERIEALAAGVARAHLRDGSDKAPERLRGAMEERGATAHTRAPLATASLAKSSIVVPSARTCSRGTVQLAGSISSDHQRQPGPASSRQRRRGSMLSAFSTIVSVVSPQKVGSSCVTNCSDSGKYGSSWPAAIASAKLRRPCGDEKATRGAGSWRRNTDLGGSRSRSTLSHWDAELSSDADRTLPVARHSRQPGAAPVRPDG